VRSGVAVCDMCGLEFGLRICQDDMVLDRESNQSDDELRFVLPVESWIFAVERVSELFCGFEFILVDVDVSPFW
jgi:hypothetical protein